MLKQCFNAFGIFGVCEKGVHQIGLAIVEGSLERQALFRCQFSLKKFNRVTLNAFQNAICYY